MGAGCLTEAYWLTRGSRLSDLHLERLISALRQFVHQAEESLRTGRRITEPDRPMTARGRRRRQTELAQAREGLAEAEAMRAARQDAEAWLRRQLDGMAGA
jgi:hypothetical protein